jgi:flagellar assembly factor FliW
VNVTTTRFGTVEVPECEILNFPSGILGFEDCQRYVILDHDTNIPLKWLQAVDRADLAFPITSPEEIVENYVITIPPADLAALGMESGGTLAIWVILRIPRGEPEGTTANLRAPVVINPATRVGRQVLTLEELPIQYALSETRAVALEYSR